MNAKLVTGIAMILISLSMSVPVKAEQIRGAIAAVRSDSIYVQNNQKKYKEYKLVLRRTHKHAPTKYFDRKREIDLSTFAGIGSFSDAIITVDGKMATRVDILSWEQ